MFHFWAVILTGAIAGAALLQALGPPLNGPERPMARQEPNGDEAIPNAPAKPVYARQTTSPAFASPEPPTDEIAILFSRIYRKKAEIAEESIHLPPSDNATEILERVSPVSSQTSPDDLARIIDVKLRLYERAHDAAGAGNFDEAERVLTLVAKLPTSPSAHEVSIPDQATPDRGTPITQGSPTETEESASPPGANASAAHSGPSSETASITATAPVTVGASPIAEAPMTTGAHRSAKPSLSIHFLANSSLAEAKARRLAARLGADFDHIERYSETNVPSTAIIRYFSAADHSAAREIGRLLGDMEYAWHIEGHSTPNPASSSGTVEVWIPKPDDQK